jgi:hypothetical protein
VPARARWPVLALLVGLEGLSILGYGWGIPWVAAAGAGAPARYVPLFAALFVVYLLAAWGVLRGPAVDRHLVPLILGFGLAFRGVRRRSPR